MSRSRAALTLAGVSARALIIMGLAVFFFLFFQGESRAADTTGFTVTPTVLDFGQVAVGSASTPQYVIVFNSGSAKLALATATSNRLFDIVSTCHDLVPLQICTILVTFNPVGAVQVSGVLTITDTLTGSGQTVQLKGTGTGGSRTPPPPQTGRVFGQVTLDGQPLPAGTGITVVLTGTLTGGTPYNPPVQTPDSSGNYSFEGLNTGLYMVSVNVPAGFKADLPASFTVDMSKNIGNAQANFNVTRAPIVTATPLPATTTTIARPTATPPPTATPVPTVAPTATVPATTPPPTPVGPGKVPITGVGSDDNFYGLVWAALALLGAISVLALLVLIRLPRPRPRG